MASATRGIKEHEEIESTIWLIGRLPAGPRRRIGGVWAEEPTESTVDIIDGLVHLLEASSALGGQKSESRQEAYTAACDHRVFQTVWW